MNFINSPKYGYLQKKAEGWFKSWTEKFCVMTNVGLLYYNESDDKPRNLFPTIDAKIEKWKGGGKTFAFKMQSFKWEIIFAAKDE